MGVKIKGLENQSEPGVHMYVFWCPGCESVHPYRVKRVADEGPEFPVWSFNGSMEKPTFRASLLVYGHRNKTTNEIIHPRCHLFLTDGMIQYCGDSEHKLAGQTVECPDWDDERW
jgi:hypothetical protein